MEKIVSAIHQLSESGKESELRQLRQFLNKRENDDAVGRCALQLDDVLGALDPTKHAVGWAVILAARAGFPTVDPTRLFAASRPLLELGSPVQLQIASREGSVGEKRRGACQPFFKI